MTTLVQVECCEGTGGSSKTPCLRQRCPLFNLAECQLPPQAGWAAILDRVQATQGNRQQVTALQENK